MKPTRRTQPYRAAANRPATPALRAMQRGRSPLVHTAPGEVRRRAMKRKPRRKSRARYKSPLHRILKIRREVS